MTKVLGKIFPLHYKGKSIRRYLLKGEFKKLLNQTTPSKPLMMIADKIFKNLWKHRSQSQKFYKTKMEKKELVQLDKKIEKLLDRIVNTQNQSVINALEKRIENFESDKLVLQEK